MTTWPMSAILLATTAVASPAHPPGPPSDKEMISMPSLCALSNASVRTVKNLDISKRVMNGRAALAIVTNATCTAEHAIFAQHSIVRDAADVERVAGVGSNNALEPSLRVSANQVLQAAYGNMGPVPFASINSHE